MARFRKALSGNVNDIKTLYQSSAQTKYAVSFFGTIDDLEAATTPATISKALKYGRDYRLGTMFQWTLYAGSGILDTVWFNTSTNCCFL